MRAPKKYPDHNFALSGRLPGRVQTGTKRPPLGRSDARRCRVSRIPIWCSWLDGAGAAQVKRTGTVNAWSLELSLSKKYRCGLTAMSDERHSFRTVGLATVRAADTGTSNAVFSLCPGGGPVLLGQGPVRSPLSGTRPDLLIVSASHAWEALRASGVLKIKKTLLLADARGGAS
jgi:hypothetical protein